MTTSISFIKIQATTLKKKEKLLEAKNMYVDRTSKLSRDNYLLALLVGIPKQN